MHRSTHTHQPQTTMNMDQTTSIPPSGGSIKKRVEAFLKDCEERKLQKMIDIVTAVAANPNTNSITIEASLKQLHDALMKRQETIKVSDGRVDHDYGELVTVDGNEEQGAERRRGASTIAAIQPTTTASTERPPTAHQNPTVEVLVDIAPPGMGWKKHMTTARNGSKYYTWYTPINGYSLPGKNKVKLFLKLLEESANDETLALHKLKALYPKWK